MFVSHVIMTLAACTQNKFACTKQIILAMMNGKVEYSVFVRCVTTDFRGGGNCIF